MTRLPLLLPLALLAALSSTSCVDLNSCNKPLSNYCAPCKGFNQRATEARQNARSFCFFANIGTCGDLRYIEESGGFGGTTEYYDASGQLVAAETSSDTNSFCSGSSFSESYGDIPGCTRLVTENLCARDDAGTRD